MLNHIRHSRLGKGAALVLGLAPFAVPTAALATSAQAAKSTKCNPKPANESFASRQPGQQITRAVSKLTVTTTTCKEGVKVVKAWGVRGKPANGKYTPAPCISESKTSCTVLKYKCTDTLKVVEPARELVSFNTTCKKGKNKVAFTGLVTRASS